MKTLLSVFSIVAALAFCGPLNACDQCEERIEARRDATSVEPVTYSDDIVTETTIPASYESYEKVDATECSSCKAACNDCEYESTDKFVIAGMASENHCR